MAHKLVMLEWLCKWGAISAEDIQKENAIVDEELKKESA